jgi:hypothetical protein
VQQPFPLWIRLPEVGWPAQSGQTMAKREDAVDLDRRLTRVVGRGGLRSLSNWIASTSLWTCPEVYLQIQIVYPRTRRRHSGEEFRSKVHGITVWRNEPAANAFWRAHGVPTGGGGSPRDFVNSHICHIYERSAHIPRHYSNLANLVAVPRALAYVTEWEPVRQLLKWKAYELYKYAGTHRARPRKPRYTPKRWPGVQQLDADGVERIVKRLQKARNLHPDFASRRKSRAK